MITRPRYKVTDWRGELVARYFRYADAQDRAIAHANGTRAKTTIWGPDGRIKWICEPKDETQAQNAAQK